LRHSVAPPLPDRDDPDDDHGRRDKSRQLRRLARLAAQLRRFRAERQGVLRRCPTGLPPLDAALGGGFVLGALHELLVSAEGAAANSLALLAATRAAESNRWILYLDARADFYPPAAARLGVPLDRLLVIRAVRSADLLWICEQALGCRSIAAVIAPLRRLEGAASRRLQLAAEAGGSLGLLIHPGEAGGPTFSATRLRLEPLAGDDPARRLRISVLKVREGSLVEPFVLELPDAAGDVRPYALSGHGPGATRRHVAAG